MTFGIYCYIDIKNNNEIVYIGKDSNIDKNIRHRVHYQSSKYNDQPINKILQQDRNNKVFRYKYKVLKKINNNKDLLNDLEIKYIKKYNPKFNFTKGGDGGFTQMTPEIQKKISNTMSLKKTQTGIKNFSVKQPSKTHNYIRYSYSYYDDMGCRKHKVSKNINKIYDFIQKNHLPWIIVDDKKADKYLKLL